MQHLLPYLITGIVTGMITIPITYLLSFKNFFGHFPMINKPKKFTLEGEPQTFSVEVFQKIACNKSFLAALLHFESWFAIEEQFNSFYFTKHQLRQIACGDCSKGVLMGQVPKYLRKRALAIIVTSVTNLKEACDEYDALRPAIYIDEQGDIYKMVNKLIRTDEDLRDVIRRYDGDTILGNVYYQKKLLLEFRTEVMIFDKPIKHGEVVA